MYFNRFPVVEYEFEINGQIEKRLVKDITLNSRVRREILDQVTLYDEYDLKEGETPEILAARLYGSPIYHWVIMLTNNRYDYIADFPIPSRAFEQILQDKYGSTLYSIRHYIDARGFIVMPTVIGATPVTNYEHEQNLNEAKRRIKLISPTMLATIVSQFRNLI